MKKCFVVLITAIVLFASVCSAENSEEVSLGGIRLGMSYEEVVAIYGEPTAKFERVGLQDGRIWAKYIEYGDNVQITFSDNKGNFGVVKNVFVSADNGWTLPSGIKVGSKESDFRKIYEDTKSLEKGWYKGWYGNYYRFEIVKNQYIIFSTPDTGSNQDTISSLQISEDSSRIDKLERNKKSSSYSEIRYIQ